MWTVGFGVFVLGSGYCAVRTWRHGASAPTASITPSDTRDAILPWRTYVLWLLLPACASVLLLAVTNQITLGVASIPFMWVLPLSLYLLTFVIAFDDEQLYRRVVFVGALGPAMVAVVWVLFGEDLPIVTQVVALLAVLFVCCMVCHGELSRLRPDPQHLTSYYLMIALGGALGGGFVALVAPRLFSDYLELHLGLVAVCGLTLTVLFTDRHSVL